MEHIDEDVEEIHEDVDKKTSEYYECTQWYNNKLKSKSFASFEEWCQPLENANQEVVKNLKRKYDSMKVYNTAYEKTIRSPQEVLRNWHLKPEKYVQNINLS